MSTRALLRYDPANFNGEKIDKLIIPEEKDRILPSVIFQSLQAYPCSPVSENKMKRTSIGGDESRRVVLRGEEL